jgi:hypothetical protein
MVTNWIRVDILFVINHPLFTKKKKKKKEKHEGLDFFLRPFFLSFFRIEVFKK